MATKHTVRGEVISDYYSLSLSLCLHYSYLYPVIFNVFQADLMGSLLVDGIVSSDVFTNPPEDLVLMGKADDFTADCLSAAQVRRPRVMLKTPT